MSKRFILTIITILVIGLAAGVAIFFAKGYTFSPKQGRIVGTGILSVTSEPDSASVYLDDHLSTATNATITGLSTKKYTVKVVKEGFIPWQKEMEIKEGLVTELKIRLFPAFPSIYPLTYTGVTNPVLSPSEDQLAYVVKSGKKGGIWVWSMAKNQPISFARSNEPHQIAQNGLIDYSTATLKWSSDSTQILATVGSNNYLLQPDRLNSYPPTDITPKLDFTLKSWDDDIKAQDQVRILSIQDPASRKIASDSAIIKWSPDETEFIYRKDPLTDKEKKPDAVISGLSVYDLETKKSYNLPDARVHFWLPDSRHVVLVEDGKVSIVEADGSNKAVVYAGSFLDSFVFAWPDSSRLVLISSYDTPTASEPNLYGINLR